MTTLHWAAVLSALIGSVTFAAVYAAVSHLLRAEGYALARRKAAAFVAATFRKKEPKVQA